MDTRCSYRSLVSLAGCISLTGCLLTPRHGIGEAPYIAPLPERSSPARSAGNAAAGKTEPEPDADDQGSGAASAPISARHLLVSYRGALRAPPGLSRTRDEARARAEQALTRARAGEQFEDLVRQYSDEPGAGQRGGNLGQFTRGTMVPAFENAAFRLKPGEISNVVETPFGFHVILRTE